MRLQSMPEIGSVLTSVLLVACAPTSRSTDDDMGRSWQSCLLRLVQSADYDIRTRALRELGQAAQQSEPARHALIRNAFSDDLVNDPVLPDVFRALSRPDAVSVSELLKGYLEEPRPKRDPFDLLILVLSRMGPRAREAIPFLLEELTSRKASPADQAAIRVALANIGHEPERQGKEVAAAIRARTPAARGAIAVMALGGVGRWATVDLLDDLVRYLDEPGDVSVDAALALGLFPGPTRGAIEKLRQRAEQDDAPVEVYALALASADPSRRSDAMRRALKRIGSDLNMHALLALALWFPSDLLNDLGKLLDDSDPEIVAGALSLVSAIGLSTRTVTLLPVLRILEATENSEDLRTMAAETLAVVGTSSEVPRLKGALLTARSEFVRKRLETTIRILSAPELLCTETQLPVQKLVPRGPTTSPSNETGEVGHQRR